MKDIKGQDFEIGDFVIIPLHTHCFYTLYEVTKWNGQWEKRSDRVWTVPRWGKDQTEGHIRPEQVLKIPKEWKDDQEKVTLHVNLAGYWNGDQSGFE